MIEALVALTISSGLIVMVGAVFLTQNEFFTWILSPWLGPGECSRHD